MAIVCLSICPVPDSKSSMEGRSKLKPMKWVTMTPFRAERSKVKVTTPLNTVTENQPYLGTGKAYKQTSNLVYGWSTMTHITDMHGDLKDHTHTIIIIIIIPMTMFIVLS